jgi:hypothetical protein
LGEGFFSGFPGYKDQSALSFLKGRSSRFLHFYAVCSIMSRQEIFLYLTSVWLRFVFIRFYKASGFSNIFGYYCEHCLFVVKIFCSLLFRKRCVFYALLSLSPVCLFWVCWVRGNFSGRPGHVLSVRMWLRCVGCRAGTILFRHSAGMDGGAVHIFLSL